MKWRLMIINEMQRKLATWTSTDQNRRVNRLLRVISHPLWLAKAAEITLSSKGARTPGVDGISKDKLQGFKWIPWTNQTWFVIRIISTISSKAYLYPKSQWKTKTHRNSHVERPNRSTSYAYGDGTNMGKWFSFIVLWFQTRTQCSPCYSDS